MENVVGLPQRVVVLGGSSDLARATLAHLGGPRLGHVVLCGRSEESLGLAAEELKNSGVGFVETMAFDVRDVAGHEKFAATVIEQIGTIDLLIVAVGVLGTAALESLDARGVADLVETNFSGVVAAMTAFAKVMIEHGHGQIVTFSSFAGVRVRRGNFVYGAAKAGLDGFSQGLADALCGTGVRMMIVRPGFVHTKMTTGLKAQPFSVSADDVATAVVRGLEGHTEIVWVPAMLRYLAAITHLIPRGIWRRLPQ